MTTLKPSRIRTFLWTSAIFSALIHFTSWVMEDNRHAFHPFEMAQFAIFGGMFFGFFSALFFTPGKITWDASRIQIHTLTGSCDFPWQHLEAYSGFAFWGLNVSLIKFRGRQTYQIWPIGFKRAEWKHFQQFLKQHHSEKKTWIWLGPWPVRFWKKEAR
ncbi:MAG: hypothetical protein EOP88_02985 [Verrucomicrobiaceae bacterium]|nr:MAG: hypothetical protein EOP88_02985 [Verrucomicrobiaceae bacterium]